MSDSGRVSTSDRLQPYIVQFLKLKQPLSLPRSANCWAHANNRIATTSTHCTATKLPLLLLPVADETKAVHLPILPKENPCACSALPPPKFTLPIGESSNRSRRIAKEFAL